MIKNKVLKGLACVALIVATVGLYIGASTFSQMSVVGDHEIAAGSTGTAETGNTGDIEPEGWDRPETEPAAEDLYGRLQVGDFSVLTKSSPATTAELEDVFAAVRGHSAYSVMDINADGTDELLWQIYRENKTDARVLAVFSDANKTGADLLIWDPTEDDNEYYLAGTQSLLYIRKNTWLISELHVTQVLFDLEGEEYAGDGISMFLVEDAVSYKEQVDPALQDRMSFITGAGVWYQRIPCGKTVEEAPVIGKTEYDLLLEEMTGLSLADISPRAEIKRVSVGRTLSGETEIFRRVRYNTPGFDVRISYPVLVNGDKASTINEAFRGKAYEMLFEESEISADSNQVSADENRQSDGLSDTVQEDADLQGADAYKTEVEAMQADYESALWAQVSYLILDEDDEYVSALFAKEVPDDPSLLQSEAAAGIKLQPVSYDRVNGRQLQLGDVAAVADVRQAIKTSQCVVMRWEEGRLQKDTELSQDQAFQLQQFDATCSGDPSWKNIGIDEQYIYIVLHEQETDEVVLRIPMWSVGVSSAGHMQLLTMHRTYPFMKPVLDWMTQVRVRKSGEGFKIDYVAESGAPVTMYLTQDKEPLQDPMAPSESRDYFAGMYEDSISMYQTGILSQTGGEEFNYYAVEEGFGAAGHVFFELDDIAWRLDYTGRMAQSFPILTDDMELGDLTYKNGGQMTRDSLRYEQWQDETTGNRRLEYMVAEDNGEEEPLMYVYTLYNETVADDNGAEQMQTMLSIYPKDNPRAEVSFSTEAQEQTVTFRDLNADSYPDLTIGIVRTNDHSDERNYLYNPQTHAYMQGPAELEEQNDYRVYPDAGFVVVTDKAYSNGTRLIKYRWNTVGEAAGTLERESTLTLTPENDALLTVLMTDDSLMPEEQKTVLEFQLDLDEQNLDTVMGLFLCNTIWESSFEALQQEEQDEVEGEDPVQNNAVRIIAAVNTQENQVASAEQTYLYLVSMDATSVVRKPYGEGKRVEYIDTVGADRWGHFYLQTDPADSGDGQGEEADGQKILIYYAADIKEDTEADTEAERQPDESIDVPALLKETGLLK